MYKAFGLLQTYELPRWRQCFSFLIRWAYCVLYRFINVCRSIEWLQVFTLSFAPLLSGWGAAESPVHYVTLVRTFGSGFLGYIHRAVASSVLDSVTFVGRFRAHAALFLIQFGFFLGLVVLGKLLLDQVQVRSRVVSIQRSDRFASPISLATNARAG